MKISESQWIAWIGATAVACLMLSTFCFTYFQSKSDAAEKAVALEMSQEKAFLQVEKRLERIESKLDALQTKRLPFRARD